MQRKAADGIIKKQIVGRSGDTIVGEGLDPPTNRSKTAMPNRPTRLPHFRVFLSERSGLGWLVLLNRQSGSGKVLGRVKTLPYDPV